MMLLVFALLLILTLLLACVSSIEIPRSHLSAYELKRLVAREDAQAIKQYKRELYLSELTTLVRLLQYVLLLAIVITAVIGFGLWYAVPMTIGIIAIHGSIARLGFISSFSRKRALGSMPHIISYLETHSWLKVVLRGPKTEAAAAHTAHSRDELAHLIESAHVLSRQDKQFLLHAFEFDERTVDERMVLRADIRSIEKAEVLGPLVLDDLHKTGHHAFPVIDTSLDTIVGILYLRNILLADSKAKTLTAEQAMEPHVAYTHQHDTLRQALAVFLEQRTHMLIVTGMTGEVVGLLTFDDLIEALFGEPITSSGKL